MTRESRRLAGILLVVLPTVMYGGVALLTALIHEPRYMANPLRQNLWRAGQRSRKGSFRGRHPDARRVLSLDDRSVGRSPSSLIAFTYVGEVVLALGVVTLGVGLLRGTPE